MKLTKPATLILRQGKSHIVAACVIRAGKGFEQDKSLYTRRLLSGDFARDPCSIILSCKNEAVMAKTIRQTKQICSLL